MTEGTFSDVAASIFSGGDRSNATSVVIHLNDMNDNAPEFQRDEYIAYISEKDTKYNVTPVIVVEVRHYH